MYSTKCPNCHQLINLKTEEVREAVKQTEAAKQKHYEMHCPKCRKPIKIQLQQLKRKLPVEPAPEPPKSEETPAS